MPRNLHLRLLLVVALATIPALLLVVEISLEQRHHEREEARANALNIAQTLASQTSVSLETLDDLLDTLVASPSMQGLDGPRCDALLGQIKTNYPAYRDANFFAADPSGWTFCHATGEMAPMYIGDRSYFLRTMSGGDLTVGEYQIGRFTGHPSIVVGEPVRADGRLVATLYASVPIDVLNARTQLVSLPGGVDFTVTDRLGTVIASNAPERIGTRDSDLEAIENAGPAAATVETKDSKGDQRLFALTPVGEPEATGLKVSVGIPTGVAYAAIDRKLVRNLLLLAASALLASATAWFGTDVFVARGAIKVVSQLRRKAFYDQLTGLANRELMGQVLAGYVAEAIAERRRAGILFVDLDGFKSINDAFGHAQGDRVLRLVARHLERIAGPQNTVARLGGDEFVVLLSSPSSAEEAIEMAERVLALSRSLQLGEAQFDLTASIGIALCPDHSGDADSLLSCADAAMYAAKHSGRNTWAIYALPGDFPSLPSRGAKSRRPRLLSRPDRAA